MNPALIQPKETSRKAFPSTGRCNLRRHRDAWRCRTAGCPFEYSLPMDLIPTSSVMGDRLSIQIQSSNGCYPSVQCDGRCGLWLSRPWPRPRKDLGTAIQCETRKHELYRECLYQLGDGLVIAHLISNDIINSAPTGPDELWLASSWRRSRQSFKFWEKDHVELQL